MSDVASVERVRGLALPRFLTADSPVPWLLPITAMLTVFGAFDPARLPLAFAILDTICNDAPLELRYDLFHRSAV